MATSTPDTIQGPTSDAMVAETPDVKPKAPSPPVVAAPSWTLLIASADTLKENWSTLPKDERLAYYQEWVAQTETLTRLLMEEADGDELGVIVEQGKLPSSMRTISAEGYHFGMFVSESWLLKELGDLPSGEKDYLQWNINTNQDGWFAEGNLEVKVSQITKAYTAGVKLLKKDPTGFRASYVQRILGSMFRDIVSLLRQTPEPKQKRRYILDVKSAFQAVVKGGVHSREAKVFVKELPSKGIPYDFDRVETVSRSVGLLK